MIEKQGTITDIKFRNEENGYTVAVFDTEGERLTVTGCFPFCHKGSRFTIWGGFKVHPRFGEQFNVQRVEEQAPEGTEGMVGFLASGVIKGIGPKTAQAIVEKFGESTFNVISDEPERLKQVSGIGEKKAYAISEAFAEHQQFAEVSLYLQKYDISANYTLKLYKEYGEETIRIVQENPYQLIDDFYGIGFQRADAIAAKMGIEAEAEERIRAGIRYQMSREIADGSTCCPKKEFCEKTGELLGVSRELTADQVYAMIFEGELMEETLDDRAMVYLYPYYRAEQNVVKQLRMLEQSAPSPVNADVEGLIKMAQSETGIEFSEEQKRAITASVGNSVMVITGGPGTGKTTIINGIIKIMTAGGQQVAVAAPTGRAAKRITETTGFQALTIHRLLEYYLDGETNTMRFGKTSEDPLDHTTIIVDEASMIDIMLMEGLVNAMKPGTRLIMVGDADQLPSVGAGNVLRDIIESEYVYAITLHEIFRQAEESLIVTNAHRINRGEYPELNDPEKDFFLLRQKTEEETAETILSLCKERLPRHYGFDPIRDIQVLTPIKGRRLGSMPLNKKLQRVLNPPDETKAEKTYGEKLFREGDKVMQIRNNYEMKWRKKDTFEEGEGIFNGDLGYIKRIDRDKGQVVVVFDDDKYVTYDNETLDELEVAYAMTVHKSQGSEFPAVVMPVSWFAPMLATRNLLYTAVTRGKQLVVLVGSEGRMHDMVDNNTIRDRYTGLRQRLQALLALEG